MIKNGYYFGFGVILFTCLMVTLVVFGEWRNPFRWIVVLWFLLVCPGMAFAHLLPASDRLTRFVLVIVMSLAVDAVVAQAILYSRRWSPHLMLSVLIGLCVLGILLKVGADIFRQLSNRAM